MYVEIEIPDQVEIMEIPIKSLPPNCDSRPPILETQIIGNDFVSGNAAAVLKVPSAIVPPESNYLINPNHPDSKKIKVVPVKQVVFDERMRIRI